MTRRSKTEWAEILGRLEGFCGTQVQFCANQGIGLASLRYHLARQHSTASRTEADVDDVAFIPVRPPADSISDSVLRRHGNAVELVIESIRLRVYHDSDPAALRLALRLAVEECGQT